MELALKTRFHKASCPVLLCNWARNQRYDAPEPFLLQEPGNDSSMQPLSHS